MKRTILIAILLMIHTHVWTDIIPDPVRIKSITTYQSCEIEMMKEIVDIKLRYNSSIVECTFFMRNCGPRVSLPVGFPVMNYFHFNDLYRDATIEKNEFTIQVDTFMLDASSIQFAEGYDEAYKAYLENEFGKQKIRHFFKWKEYEKYLRELEYPWYVWNVTFEAHELKTIKVRYNTQTGTEHGNSFRYLRYLLSTGASWKGKIKEATVQVELSDINVEELTEIRPSGYKIDHPNKKLTWQFTNLEPSERDDIFIRYVDSDGSSFRDRMFEKELMDRLKLFAANPQEQNEDTTNQECVGPFLLKTQGGPEDLPKGNFLIAGAFKLKTDAGFYADGLTKMGFESAIGYQWENSSWLVYIYKDEDGPLAKIQSQCKYFRKMKIFKDVWLVTIQE